jgi:hypothetical protein
VVFCLWGEETLGVFQDAAKELFTEIED